MPPWVVTLAQGIKFHLLPDDVIKEPLRSGPVPAAIHVEQDRRRGPTSGLTDTADRRPEQPPQLRPLRRGIIGPADPPIGPEHATDNLIAHLDIIGHGARV